MIDDNGVARLATAGRSSIVAVPNTSVADFKEQLSVRDLDYSPYSAPEILWPEEHGKDKIVITKESDVYGIGMIVYEASSHHSVLSVLRVKSHVCLAGLDGEQAVLQMEQRDGIGKDTRRGNTSTIL